MRILRHLGSNFPERDGGAVLVQRRDGSVWLLHVKGCEPGGVMDVESFDLGKTERGYRSFVQRLATALGFDDDPANAIAEIGEELDIKTAEARRLASSIDGRATLFLKLLTTGWWEGRDVDTTEASYAHIQRVWVMPSKQQRRFSFEVRA